MDASASSMTVDATTSSKVDKGKGKDEQLRTPHVAWEKANSKTRKENNQNPFSYYMRRTLLQPTITSVDQACEDAGSRGPSWELPASDWTYKRDWEHYSSGKRVRSESSAQGEL